MTRLERQTRETQIQLSLNLQGSGQYDIETGIGFFDHMLAQLARHGFMDIELKAKGDLEVDCHHTVEDVGILLGKALSKEIEKIPRRRRYGSVMLPMDESLIACAVDLGGRPYLKYYIPFTLDRLGQMEIELFQEFFIAFVNNSGINLHIKVMEPGNNHHMIEGAFKAVARAIDEAKQIDERLQDVLSTKGMLEVGS